MNDTLRSVLLGARRDGPPPYLTGLVAVGGFLASLAGYALGVFEVSGGVVWMPFHAAVVGIAAACLLGGVRRGLLAAWVGTYAALLGYHADHAFFGLSGRTLGERFAYFVEPDGLAFLAVEAVVLGTIAFLLGRGLRLGFDAVRSDAVVPLTGERD